MASTLERLFSPPAPGATRGFRVREAGPEADKLAGRMWRDCGVAGLAEDWAEQTQQFIGRAREELGYRTLVAMDNASGAVIGSACVQVWAGPAPTGLADHDPAYGSVWAVYVQPEHRGRGVAGALMQRAKDVWEAMGCTKGLLLHASEPGRRVYQRVGFGPGEMITLDLAAAGRSDGARAPDGVSLGEQIGSEQLVLEHTSLARQEAGLSRLDARGQQRLRQFLEETRATRGGRTFTARLDGRIVGSVNSSIWAGPLPLVVQPEVLKMGTCWGLYVCPTVRHRGIGTALMDCCIAHWRELECNKGVVLCSKSGLELCLKMGFEPGNAMVVQLSSGKDQTGSALVERARQLLSGKHYYGADVQLGLLLTALPQQLEAAREQGCLSAAALAELRDLQEELGTAVREDNWFQRNVTRFGGGFDMTALSKRPSELAAKFDRLASRYDHWVVGNRSVVEGWLGRTCAVRCVGGAAGLAVADIACGIGLPGQTLRLCGYKGRMMGCDISPQMVERAVKRGGYDDVIVANANEQLPWGDNTADIAICTGAMELLDQRAVLQEAVRVLKPNGELWASFQWDQQNGNNPTAHQNVRGTTTSALEQTLNQAGFRILSIEKCECAFLTPAPTQDGSLLPVPYLFVIAVVGNPAPSALHQLDA